MFLTPVELMFFDFIKTFDSVVKFVYFAPQDVINCLKNSYQTRETLWIVKCFEGRNQCLDIGFSVPNTINNIK